MSPTKIDNSRLKQLSRAFGCLMSEVVAGCLFAATRLRIWGSGVRIPSERAKLFR